MIAGGIAKCHFHQIPVWKKKLLHFLYFLVRTESIFTHIFAEATKSAVYHALLDHLTEILMNEPTEYEVEEEPENEVKILILYLSKTCYFTTISCHPVALAYFCAWWWIWSKIWRHGWWRWFDQKVLFLWSLCRLLEQKRSRVTFAPTWSITDCAGIATQPENLFQKRYVKTITGKVWRTCCTNFCMLCEVEYDYQLFSLGLRDELSTTTTMEPPTSSMGPNDQGQKGMKEEVSFLSPAASWIPQSPFASLMEAKQLRSLADKKNFWIHSSTTLTKLLLRHGWKNLSPAFDWSHHK